MSQIHIAFVYSSQNDEITIERDTNTEDDFCGARYNPVSYNPDNYDENITYKVIVD